MHKEHFVGVYCVNMMLFVFDNPLQVTYNKSMSHPWSYWFSIHLLANHASIAVLCDVCLQSEYHIFVEEFKKNPGQIWIMKPIAKSQGKGIFLFRRLKDIVEWKKVTVEMTMWIDNIQCSLIYEIKCFFKLFFLQRMPQTRMHTTMDLLQK